jgi:hypothetical protein
MNRSRTHRVRLALCAVLLGAGVVLIGAASKASVRRAAMEGGVYCGGLDDPCCPPELQAYPCDAPYACVPNPNWSTGVCVLSGK